MSRESDLMALFSTLLTIYNVEMNDENNHNQKRILENQEIIIEKLENMERKVCNA